MIASYLAKTRESIERLATDPALHALLEEIGTALCRTLEAGNKILLAGNGGSAADCQHMAGELAVRFRKDRPALAGIALTVDSSVLTACLNDYGPLPVFARQVEALGREGDVLWAFSTSGNSANIIEACKAARRIGMKVLGFTGGQGGELARYCDWCFVAPSDSTSHIQECHITAGHLLCWFIEEHHFYT
ncbi:MAG: D-sedoheptulose 7-phosphate isomerase [Planctomycetaceae bacterium]|nr:D-sedoheptulose 7-phosphate isomerase [Planctomycetaceae bacterium]